jgi:protein-S-isoprenylcysteine O-methyltransferase Ste14
MNTGIAQLLTRASDRTTRRRSRTAAKSWWQPVLWVAFAALQIARARVEERKLARATAGYAEYQSRTWQLLPFIL